MAPAREGGLLVGRIGRPHGLDGSFYVTAPAPRALREGVAVTLAPAGIAARIVRRAGTDARPIVRLDAAADRDAAAALRGSELRVERAAAPPLPDDEYWAEELVGCVVADGDVEVGTVVRMLALPSCECLEVERPDRAPMLVPLVRDAVRSIDVQRRRIDIDLEFLGETGSTPVADPES